MAKKQNLRCKGNGVRSVVSSIQPIVSRHKKSMASFVGLTKTPVKSWVELPVDLGLPTSRRCAVAAFGVRDLPGGRQGLSYVHRVVVLQVVSVEYRKAKGNHAGIFRFLLVCTGKNGYKKQGGGGNVVFPGTLNGEAEAPPIVFHVCASWVDGSVRRPEECSSSLPGPVVSFSERTFFRKVFSGGRAVNPGA